MAYGCIDDNREPSGEVLNGAMPELSNLEFVSHTASTVELKSNVTKANGYTVVERGFCWGTEHFPTIVADGHLAEGEGKGEFTATVESLLGNTKYYFRAYATNGKGTSYSPEDSLVTSSGLGIVRTLKVTDRRATTAVGGGKIELYGEGQVVSYGLFKASSKEMTNKDTILSTNPIVADSFLCNISGLSADTRYYVQAFVRNHFGTFVGDVEEFSTGNGKPVIDLAQVLDPTIDIGYTEVTVASGVLAAGDGALRERGFCWNEEGSPSVESSAKVPCGNEIGPFVAQVTGLTPQRTYYFRAYARNDFGTVYSNELAIQTKSQLPSLRTNMPVVNNSLGTVIAGGQILDQGRSPIVAKGVCYSSVDPRPSLTSGTTASLGVSDAFTFELSDLRGETIYYICAYARNNEGVSYGEIMTFTTPQIFNGGLSPFKDAIPLEASSAYFMIGDRFYLLGGDMGANYTNKLWRYNRANDDWGEGLSYHSALKWPTAVGHGQSAYVLGGMSLDGVVSDDFYQYVQSPTNWWYPMPKGPDSASRRTGIAVENDIYYFGGLKDTAKNDVWEFHISGASGAWTKKTDLPAAQYGGIAVRIDNAAFVGLGKNTAGVCNKTLWKSTDGMMTWSQETENPTIGNGVLVGVSFKGKIYVVDESHRIHEYNPEKALWRAKSLLPSSMSDVLCMYVLNDLIFIGFGNNSLIIYNPLWDN